MEQQTLTNADRTLSEFILNASGSEHRAQREELVLSPADYSTIWKRVHDQNSSLFQKSYLKGRGLFAEGIKLSYVANKSRYSLTIRKALPLVKAAA